ncbi:hypothetical protein [Novosphingobium sp. Gsoil 351]|uniref:hypothetical protein n=1 Tax=Novosphingobium sp. Gsoil 351 TaxID=2675225 RepID=UPI0012B47123|nr:hypothetical protein [Novosphingobium sp. Gsoil 351]QGN55925.1 hypothetical protein GKE62_16550 [Novosphingobium sp. Gsoil 351]
MISIRLLTTLAGIAFLSACAAPRKPEPAPLPAPPPPRPVATAIPAQPPADWRDAPATAGAWSYVPGTAGSAALFANDPAAPLAGLRCDRPGGRVALSRAGAAPGPLPLTIVTSTLTRAFTASPESGATPQLSLQFAPRDPVLDAMAFSRGRFVIEVAGLPTLYLPAWPEIARVIEDCR